VHALAVLSWDPQIRGFLIVAVAVATLCGSVYLLLSTNLGARLGFLVALAGLTGWIAMLSLIWTIYGIGDKGAEPTWKPLGIITGAVGPTARPPLDQFPRGWHQLPDGDPKRAEAQATVDELLTKGTKDITAPFNKTTDYIVVNAYDIGGKRRGIHVLDKGITWGHQPHYAAIKVQPAVVVVPQPGQKPPTPAPDPSKPPLTILMVRDLGAVRLPSAMIFLSSVIIFGLTLSALHRRDKAAMRARGILPAPAPAPAPSGAG
jgi:hypothetical protein